ncbi:hypothetical protein WN48_00368 [Eufriesea mexicana]|nr:hypothetical protein WN48_00368 [Eufriesea mexicana]
MTDTWVWRLWVDVAECPSEIAERNGKIKTERDCACSLALNINKFNIPIDVGEATDSLTWKLLEAYEEASNGLVQHSCLVRASNSEMQLIKCVTRFEALEMGLAWFGVKSHQKSSLISGLEDPSLTQFRSNRGLSHQWARFDRREGAIVVYEGQQRLEDKNLIHQAGLAQERVRWKLEAFGEITSIHWKYVDVEYEREHSLSNGLKTSKHRAEITRPLMKFSDYEDVSLRTKNDARERVEIRDEGMEWGRVVSMHAVGLHSALAIKRQRKRRDEQRRARERRYSAQSGESGLTSPRASTGSLDHQPRHHKSGHTNRSAGQGMLDSKWGSKRSGSWWNELVAVGLFVVFIGMFLIILNKVIAKKEENELEEYVQRQLTRSRSGHRLERDPETGGLTTKHARRARQMQQAASTGSIETQNEKDSGSPPRSPPPAYSPPPTMNGDNQAVQSALYLEQITEEEIISDRVETSTTNSLSPGSPSETRELLQNPRYSKQNGNPQQVHRPLYVSRI